MIYDGNLIWIFLFSFHLFMDFIFRDGAECELMILLLTMEFRWRRRIRKRSPIWFVC